LEFYVEEWVNLDLTAISTRECWVRRGFGPWSS